MDGEQHGRHETGRLRQEHGAHPENRQNDMIDRRCNRKNNRKHTNSERMMATRRHYTGLCAFGEKGVVIDGPGRVYVFTLLPCKMVDVDAGRSINSMT